MGKYTDDEIRNMSKITCKIAGEYLGISPNAVSCGMRNEQLPIGFAVHTKNNWTDSWAYNIVPERLIAYNHGKINELQIQSIDKNLETIIAQFTDMKNDLSFLLRGKDD